MLSKGRKSVQDHNEKSPKAVERKKQMAEGLEHLILTRFNLAIRFGCGKRFDSNVPADKPWLDPEYLDKRFDIFETYTFPSFQKQTVQDFKWIVLFHADTPEIFKKRISGLQEQMEQFCPLFLDDGECRKMAAVLKDHICQHYAGKKIITTRVDNDDAVHAGFVEDIRKRIGQEGEKQGTVLTYVNGLQYDIRTKEVLKYRNADNHFLTLYVEDISGENHILFFNHDHISKTVADRHMKMIKAETKIPLWVEIITENNFSNTPRWRFSACFVSYGIKEAYPLLNFKWSTKAGWLLHCSAGIIKVFFHRGKGILRMLKRADRS